MGRDLNKIQFHSVCQFQGILSTHYFCFNIVSDNSDHFGSDLVVNSVSRPQRFAGISSGRYGYNSFLLILVNTQFPLLLNTVSVFHCILSVLHCSLTVLQFLPDLRADKIDKFLNLHKSLVTLTLPPNGYCSAFSFFFTDYKEIGYSL